MTGPSPEAFYARCVRDPDTGCLEWQRCRAGDGYGQVGWWEGGRSVTRRAHRVAWEFTHGPIPDGLWVLHRCDNPPCVEISHLFLGTHLENMRDRDAKGRQARGEQVSLHGERNGQAKLTVAQVAEIRARYAAGGVTQTALAAEFGVHQTHVSDIVRGVWWRRPMPDKPQNVDSGALPEAEESGALPEAEESTMSRGSAVPSRDVRGRCPACHRTSLFLADGGYVTCGSLDCRNPTAASDLLEAVSGLLPSMAMLAARAVQTGQSAAPVHAAIRLICGDDLPRAAASDAGSDDG